MSTRTPPSIGRLGGPYPVVRGRRMHDLLLAAVTGLIPLGLGLAITLSSPHPNWLLIFGILIGLALVAALLLSRRYDVTLTLLALYLGLIDGPVKLESASKVSSGVRDVLIVAVALGMIMRLVASKDRLRLPPLTGWVVAFVGIVLVEALNPYTHGILKVIGGWRQLLEWIPFFFFGYMIMRSNKRFRQLFMLLGAIALLNGVVGAIQAHISTGSLASWGPGYAGLVHGGHEGTGLTARTYKSNGVTHARPPALGSDSGFGGGVGVLALPGLLALLVAGKVRRRWLVVLFALGAVLGIATAASRTSVVSAIVVLISFGALSLLAGIRVGRAFTVLVTILALAVGVATVLVGVEGSGIFARQESLTSSEVHGAGAKERNLAEIPSDIARAPLGVGLGTSGSVGGFGGTSKVELEGEKVTGGSAYTLLWKEAGGPGLLIWIGLTLSVILLAVTRLRKVRDVELRTYLLGLLVAFIALTVQGLSGPTLAVTIGAFLWFVPGVISYWLAGDGRAEAFGASAPVDRAAPLVPAVSGGAL